jgi:hypothetical protein
MSKFGQESAQAGFATEYISISTLFGGALSAKCGYADLSHTCGTNRKLPIDRLRRYVCQRTYMRAVQSLAFNRGGMNPIQTPALVGNYTLRFRTEME